MFKNLAKHIAWVFFPARFLFGSSLDKVLRIKGWETLYFVDQPDEVKAVNAATGGVFLGGAGNEFLQALLGPQSVFCMDHQQHRLARRVMGPVLTKKAVIEWTPDIDKIIAQEIASLRSRQSVIVGKWSRRVCMRIVCRVALGLEAPPTINRILNRFEAATGYLANIVSYAKPLWKSNGPMSLGAITEWYVKRIDAEIYPLIAQEKRRFASVNRNNTQCDTAAPQAESNKSVLQQLVELQSVHGYDDAFIRDNLVAILAAGYDTSGSALSWMIYWLCRETGQFELLTEAQQQGNSKALDSFRDEVLRYCPPIEILPRRIDPAKQEEARTLIGGLNAITDPSRPDPMVCPFIHRIHHNPDIYDEPEVFKADRFQGSQTFNNNEFLPFGAGHRMCIGLNLGKGILDRTLAAMIEQRLKLETRQILFKPIRRNVSIWPGHSLRATIVND